MTGRPDPVLRPLATLEERQACVALQEETWGADFRDRVPASILMAAEETGGVASGAFEGDRLVGFVFGITGVREGRLVHWSDMLAVRPTHRGRGLGHALKLHQRERLLELGVETVFWTFDPLESRNAHLNLRGLGAIVRTYRRDFYGPSDSPLHAGIGTDRLVAEWEIGSSRVRRRLEAMDDAGRGDGERLHGGGSAGPIGHDSPVLNPPGPAGPMDFAAAAGSAGPHPAPSQEVGPPEGPEVRVAIPRDIQRLKAADGALAMAWRHNVRAALERCFEAGYVAVDLVAGGETSSYVLTRDAGP